MGPERAGPGRGAGAPTSSCFFCICCPSVALLQPNRSSSMICRRGTPPATRAGLSSPSRGDADDLGASIPPPPSDAITPQRRGSGRVLTPKGLRDPPEVGTSGAV